MTSTATMAHPGGRRAYRLVRRPAPAAQLRLDDPTQRQIIEHTVGPLLVLGGPGTGKTEVLVESVAARVAQGVDPESILVLTFGRRAALRLRDRIEGRLGAGGGHRLTTTAEPMVRTFHGYAFGLLRRAAAARGEPAPRLLTGPEQDLIIRELLATPDERVDWPPSLHGAVRTHAFATELRDLILRAIERGIGPDQLRRLARERRRPDWTAAAQFFAEYREVLALRDATGRGSIAYDYAELVRAATALLAGDRELLTAERRRLSMVFVDALPDTDPAQVDLLATVAGNGGGLVAFADPDSSTFAFRGADPSIVSRFTDRFRSAAGAPAAQLTLLTSYRMAGDLLVASRRVAQRMRGPARQRGLEQAEHRAATVETRTFGSAASEAALTALRLREAHLLRGVPWSRMAVLVRSVRQVAALQRALHQAGVPTVTQAEDLPLHVLPAIAPLLLLLRCALDPDRLDEEAAIALLHSPLGGADPLAERRLRQGLRALALAGGVRRPSGVLLVDALCDPTELAAVQRRWARPALAVAGLLAAARAAAARPGASAEDVLWTVWARTGLAQRWSDLSARGGHRGAAADRDLDAVLTLFDAAARFTDRLPGAGIGVFCDHVEGQDLPVDSLAPAADRGEAVRILTAHAAKGLEFDVVAVTGVQEGVWPDLRLRGSVLGSELLVDVVAGRELETVGRLSALLDEERRLFYVAVSRAREQVLVTAVASGDGEDQPSRFLAELAGADPDDEDGSTPGLPRPLTLPALVAELRVALVDPDAGDERRASAAELLACLASRGVPGADPQSWWGLPVLSDDRPLIDPGEPVRVTPSTVDIVQRCSLRWLLERHGGSLTASPEQSIGNLVHAAAMLASDASVDRAALVGYVADRFDAIELSARWLAGRERERAEVMLDKLIGWLAANPRRLVAIEKDFLVELADADSPVQIRGRVDRLEVDEQGRLVVIDLKTGRTVPTGADLAEHPQLAAYQAAIEAGAFDEAVAGGALEAGAAQGAAAHGGAVAGGAALVQLGGDTAGAREQVQRPLAESDDPTWAQALVRRTAKAMAASTFEAVANNRCRMCPVKTSCPVSGKGRPVTGEVP